MSINEDGSSLALAWVNRILFLSILGVLIVFFANLYVHTQLGSLLKNLKTKDEIFQINPLNLSKLEFYEHTKHSYYPTDVYLLKPFFHIKILERFNAKCKLSETSFAECPNNMKSTDHVMVSSRYLKKAWVFFFDEHGKIIRKRKLRFS